MCLNLFFPRNAVEMVFNNKFQKNDFQINLYLKEEYIYICTLLKEL